jgi:hypothetical protein
MGAAAPAIITVVAVAASIVAGPEVGTAILSEMGVVGASAATTAAVGAAAISGTTSAVNTAIAGGNVEDVLKAGATGAAAGAIGSEVGSAVSEGVTDLAGGQVSVPSDAGPTVANPSIANISGGTAGGATKAFTQAELSGSNLQQAIKQAEIGGATGLITSGVGELAGGLGADAATAREAGAVAGILAKPTVSNLFNPPTSTSAGQAGQTSIIGSAPTTGQAGTTPSSSALAQALNIGGGEISPPVQLGQEGSTKSVWNQASLRTPSDESGA